MDERCQECGIAERIEADQLKCIKLGKIFNKGECILTDCIYFIEKVFEDGECLTPLEHLLIMEQKLKSRHMKGPI